MVLRSVLRSPLSSPLRSVFGDETVIPPPVGDTLQITREALTVTFSELRTVGQYADGSYWVYAPDSDQVTFTGQAMEAGTEAEEWESETCTYMGTPMVDPATSDIQGFDDRTSVNGLGPGAWYSASVAQSFPLTAGAYPNGSPKTALFYRGRDSVVFGGTNSGTWSILSITLVSTPPPTNAIRPTMFYVAGGKPQYTTSNITLPVPYAVPGSAVEPDWTAQKGFLKSPRIRFGNINSSAFIAPYRHDWTYPAAQARETAAVIMGALSSVSNRLELAARIVREMQDVEALFAFTDGTTPNLCIVNGGFGIGDLQTLVAGKKLLGLSVTIPPNVDYQTQDMPYFQEHGNYALGAPTGTYPEGKPLWGSKAAPNYPEGPNYGDNHGIRDPGAVPENLELATREPQHIPHHSGACEGATSTTLSFDKTALAAAGGVPPSPGYMIVITGGAGAGQTRVINSPGGWDDTNKIATVSVPWTTVPTAGDAYYYSNAGAYQYSVAGADVSGANALVLGGWVDDAQYLPWFLYCWRWTEDLGGVMDPPIDPSYGASTPTDDSLYGDTPGTWAKQFYLSYSRDLWPQQNPTLADPLAVKDGTTNFSGTVGVNADNGPLSWVITQSDTSPTFEQVEAGQNHLGAAGDDSGSQTVTAGGTQAITGNNALADGPLYYAYYAQETDAGGRSTVRGTSYFPQVLPVLTLPTGTADGANNFTGTVTSTVNNGDCYWIASLWDTKPGLDQIEAGLDHNGDPASDSGVETVTSTSIAVTGNSTLTQGETYYIHYMQKRTTGGQSTVVASAGFTTDAADVWYDGWAVPFTAVDTSGIANGFTLWDVFAIENLTVYPGATKIRITYEGSTVGYTLDETFVGNVAGNPPTGGAGDTDAPPIRITFGGSNSAVVPVSGDLVSDEIDFVKNTTTDLMVSFYGATPQTGIYAPNAEAMSGDDSSWYESGNSAGSQVKNPGGSNTGIGFYCVKKVEFFGPTI